MLKSNALWHLSTNQSQIKESDLNEENKVIVKSLYSLISLGTERLVANGKVPKDLHNVMKVPYMGGHFEFPVKYGYSLVGQVQSSDHPLSGKYVHLLHPHQDFCCVDETDCFVIPEGVDLGCAALASNLETAVNAVWDSGASIGDRILILGFGLIGSLLARVLTAISGTKVVVSDIDPDKTELAKDLGFEVIENPRDTKFDLAFNCSANAEGLQTCIDATGFESKIIELSWYGDQSVSLKLGGSFHQQRKEIISSQVSSLPVNRRGRWDYQRRKEIVFDLLKKLNFSQHLTTTINFVETPEYFEKVRKGKASDLGILISYT